MYYLLLFLFLSFAESNSNSVKHAKTLDIVGSTTVGSSDVVTSVNRHSYSDSNNNRKQSSSNSNNRSKTVSPIHQQLENQNSRPAPLLVTSDSHKNKDDMVLSRSPHSSLKVPVSASLPEHSVFKYTASLSHAITTLTTSTAHTHLARPNHPHTSTQATNSETHPRSHGTTSKQSLVQHTTTPVSTPQALVYSERDPDYQAVKSAAECLHAHDYTKMADILEQAPTTIPVLFGKGLAYYKLTKYSAASKALDEILHRSENDPELKGHVYLSHYYLGEIDLGHARYDRAAEHFEKSAAAFTPHTIAKRYRIIPPSLAILYSKKGSALNHSQKVMAAVKSYKQAIEFALIPKDKLAACTSLGNLYQSLGDNQNALQYYQDTIKLAEELQDFVYLGWAHGNLGNAYLGLLQKEKALFHLEKSLELTVDNEPSPQAIGRAYNNLGESII